MERTVKYPNNVVRDMFYMKLNPTIKTQLLHLGHESPDSLPTCWNELITVCILAENRSRIQEELEKQTLNKVVNPQAAETKVSFMAVSVGKKEDLTRFTSGMERKEC
jgi:hypothetical protein